MSSSNEPFNSIPATPSGPKLSNPPRPSLITKIDPVYPPLALQARIQGSVEFTATVGTDGKVQNLQLVRGHQLLVNAAKDAVLHYVYRPTKFDGAPIPFQTDITIQFSLDR